MLFLITILSLILTFISTFVFLYIKWFFSYWSRKGVPTPPITFPYGNARELLQQKISLGESVAHAYHALKHAGHKFCGYYIGFHKIFLIFHPDLIKTILTKDFVHFTDHGNYINEQNDPLSGHLFMLKGQRWKTRRAKLTPTFTSAKTKMTFGTMLACTKQLVAVMEAAARNAKPIDMKDVSVRFNTDVIGSCAFGLECNSLKSTDSEFVRFTQRAFEMDRFDAVKRLVASSLPWLMDTLRWKLTHDDVIEFFTNIVQQTIEYRERNKIDRQDLMQLLIQLKNRTDGGLEEQLTIREIAAEMFGFFFAGFETTSSTLSFCIYELVCNLEVQEKLRDEVAQVLEKHGGVTYECLAEMVYMEKCINETLRKYPPSPFIIRGCTKRFQIPNSKVTIDQGTRIFIPILGLQNDPEYYPDPEKFDPERFSPENKAGRPDFTWLPFGEGPRACIGIRFGMMQLKVALAVLLQKFKFRLNPKTPTPVVIDPSNLTLNISGELWIDVECV